MKTKWDYTDLAKAYLKRPDYSKVAIDSLLKIAGVSEGVFDICDIGAGVAHLTLMLAEHDHNVVAVEPNDAMRTYGAEKTSEFKNVTWVEATGEDTKQQSLGFDLVTFGSSFNVCDSQKALSEASRILKSEGWFVCLWNHRNLEDSIQSGIERIIKEAIPNYNYGSRRQDQTPIIEASNLYKNIVRVSSRVYHKQSVKECVEAWKSHATLQRQAGKKFNEIISKIEAFLTHDNAFEIDIPYDTSAWIAQVKK